MKHSLMSGKGLGDPGVCHGREVLVWKMVGNARLWLQDCSSFALPSLLLSFFSQ